MESPIVWLEKNLFLISTVVDARDKPENKGKFYTEDQNNYYLELVKLKADYEKSLALLKASGIE